MKTYRPSKLRLTLGANAHGFDDGEFISVARNVEKTTLSVGADAEVTRTVSEDDTGTGTITLKQSSTFNGVLSGLLASQEIVPFLLKEGLTTIAAGEAWVSNGPTVSYGKESTNRPWIITLSNMKTFFIGGNLDD